MSKQQSNDAVVHGAMQFSTRALLGGIAGCAVLILVMQQVGAVWSTAIIWFLLLIGAHVAANVRGSRLSSDSGAPRPPTEISGSGSCDVAARFAPATRLRDSRRFGRALLAVTSSMAAVGLLLGTGALILLTPADAGGIVLGGISAGVLGGLLGFVLHQFRYGSNRRLPGSRWRAAVLFIAADRKRALKLAAIIFRGSASSLC